MSPRGVKGRRSLVGQRVQDLGPALLQVLANNPNLDRIPQTVRPFRKIRRDLVNGDSDHRQLREDRSDLSMERDFWDLEFSNDLPHIFRGSNHFEGCLQYSL